MKQIFPKEIIDNTLEVHQFKHKTKSKIIYTFLLLILIGTLIALPFVTVSVYSTTTGIIKPDKERITIQNITSGKVIYTNLKNNQKINKGDTLLIINNVSLQHQLAKNTYQKDELKQFTNDLESLINKDRLIVSAKYKQEFATYKQRLHELQTRYKKVREDLKRTKKLYKKDVVAKIELENIQLNFDLALNAISQFKKQQFASWQSQLIDYQNKLKELESNEAQLQERKELSIIKAPYTGTLLNVIGIEKGSFIAVGTQLAQLTPTTNLIVECFVSPNNIGLLKKQHTANFQISAFNYNQWGLATGKITDIANDVQLINNTPMFRVLCNLDQDYLELKNGFKGYFKKGMTLNARFEVTKRTLFDLLYDNIDDWLNPTSPN